MTKIEDEEGAYHKLSQNVISVDQKAGRTLGRTERACRVGCRAVFRIDLLDEVEAGSKLVTDRGIVGVAETDHGDLVSGGDPVHELRAHARAAMCAVEARRKRGEEEETQRRGPVLRPAVAGPSLLSTYLSSRYRQQSPQLQSRQLTA